MTTIQSTGVRNHVLRMVTSSRATTLHDVQSTLEDLKIFLTVHVAVTFDENPGLFRGEFRDVERPNVATTLDVAEHRFANQAPVTRVHMNSPLELVLYVGGVGSILYRAATWSLVTFERYQHARITKADADYQVAAYTALTERLRRKADSPATDRQINEFSDRGSGALRNMANLEVLPEDELDR